MQPEQQQDNVFSLPNIEIDSIPELTNFEYPKQLCVQLIEQGSKEFEGVLNGADVTRNAFREIFPEVVQSRNTTHMDDKQQFVRWNSGENIVQVELEPYTSQKQQQQQDERYDCVAVGGPAAIMAAVLYGIRKQETGEKAKFLYGVTSRFDSNHDGSAYYVHERDCFAVYCNPSNRGLFVVYEDARKRLAKAFFMDNFVKEIKERRNYLKFNMNYANITPGVVFKIFIPNQYYAYTDLIKTTMGNPQDTFLAQTAQHSARKDKIIQLVEKYTGKHSIFIPDSDKHQALHIVFNQKEECIDHFHWLTNFLPIPFYELSQEQRKNLSSVMETYLRFPRDGIVSPFAFEAMKQILHKQGAQVMQDFKLNKITLAKDARGDLAVKKITWTDAQTNQQHEMQTDKLMFSLGPSSILVAQPPEYSLWQHAKDTLSYKLHDMFTPSVTVSADSFVEASAAQAIPSQHRPAALPYYKPTLKSMYRHFLNIAEEPFGGNELYKKFMWAAGSTSVVCIGVDLNKVSEDKLGIFRHFLGGENHHWTPIAERQVTDKQGKKFQFFAVQMTGGGNFPTRYMSPDIVLNLLISTERIFDLDKGKNDKAVTYDLVQTRGCGRAVSAKNAINFVVLSKGAVGSYALGGLGMTTMYSNGELMNELVELREQLANGKIDQQEFHDRLYSGQLNSPYSQQLYGVDNVLEGVNYTKLVDDIQKTARKLGHDDSLSENEKMTHAIIGAGCVATATAGFWLKQKRNKAAKPKTMAVAQQFNKQQTYLKDLTVKTKQRAGNTVAYLKHGVQNLKTKAGSAVQKLLNLVKK